MQGMRMGTVVGERGGRRVVVAVSTTETREVLIPAGLPLPGPGDDVAWPDPSAPDDALVLKNLAAKPGSPYAEAAAASGFVVVSRTAPPRDPVLKWAVGVYDDPGVRALRNGLGYALIADPLEPWLRGADEAEADAIQSGVPHAGAFVWGARIRSAVAAPAVVGDCKGRAGAFQSVLPFGPWTAALSVPFDPTLTGLSTWREVGGHEPGTLPRSPVSAADAFRFSAAHEIGHRMQIAFGFQPPADDDARVPDEENARRTFHGECFADAAAILLLSLHGGADAAAASMAASRMARDPRQGASHATVLACAAALERVREYRAAGATPSPAELLNAAAGIAAAQVPEVAAVLRKMHADAAVEAEPTAAGKAAALERQAAAVDAFPHPLSPAVALALRLAASAWRDGLLAPADARADRPAALRAHADDARDGVAFLRSLGAPAAAAAMAVRAVALRGAADDQFVADLGKAAKRGADAAEKGVPAPVRPPGRLFVPLANGPERPPPAPVRPPAP